MGRNKKPLINARLIRGLFILNGGARVEIPQTVSVKIPENGIFTVYSAHFSAIHSGSFSFYPTFSLEINAL